MRVGVRVPLIRNADDIHVSLPAVHLRRTNWATDYVAFVKELRHRRSAVERASQRGGNDIAKFPSEIRTQIWIRGLCFVITATE